MATEVTETAETTISVGMPAADNPSPVAHMGVYATLPHLVDKPLLVSMDNLGLFASGLLAYESQMAALPELERRLGADDDTAEVADDFWGGFMARRYRPYNVQAGVLTIPVSGSLVDGGTITLGGWFTGYEYIRRAFHRGMDDPGVESIVLDIDSSGGHAAGNFELAAEMSARRGEKPTLAFANGRALSGAYSLATTADAVVGRKSSLLGSIGVLRVHAEESERLASEGVNVSVIRSGKHKAEVNPVEPLSDHARERLQHMNDEIYGDFVNLVANNRAMKETQVKATEGDVFTATEAVGMKLADRIGDMPTETKRLAGGQLVSGETNQSDNSGQTAVDEASIAAATRKAERQRFAAVMASDEYAGREQLGQRLLAETEMDAATICSMLGAAPKVEPKTEEADKRDHFKEHMDKTGGAGVDQADSEEPEVSENAHWPGRPEGTISILSAYRASGGRVNDDIKRTKQHG